MGKRKTKEKSKFHSHPRKTLIESSKYWILKVPLATLLFFVQSQVVAQDIPDSIFLDYKNQAEFFASEKNFDPSKAAMYSAIIPGLGQAYNKQYWKIPVIYAGFMSLFHYIDYYHEYYHAFRTAAIAEVDSDENTINKFTVVTSSSNLVRNRDLFRRNRDFLMILTALLYGLNIVEANVSAHLSEFEVDRVLSMNIQPTLNYSPVSSPTPGISLVIRFK